MFWTASVNVYENNDRLAYSVRMWRVAESKRTFLRPDVKFTGSMPSRGSENPTRWLQGFLEELRIQLLEERRIGN